MSGEELQSVLDRKRLPALDGLRAVAVVMVIVSHTGVKVPADLGVSAFFVLSGFLITRLLLQELAESGGVSLHRFYMRRTLRIFPAYYALLALSFELDRAHGIGWSRAMLASSAAYAMNYFNALHGHPDTSISQLWSLAVEEQFYLIWPVLFLIGARRGRSTLIWMLVGISAAVLAWRSWLFLGANVGTAYVYNALDTRFDNLAIGCLTAVLVGLPRAAKIGAVVAANQWLPVATLLALAASRYALPQRYHYSLGFTVNALLVALLLVQLMLLHARPMWRWLEGRGARFLGAISYPMYLYHGWGRSGARHLPLVRHLWEPVATVLVTALLASVSYYGLERPFLALRNRWAASRLDPLRPDAAPAPRVRRSLA